MGGEHEPEKEKTIVRVQHDRNNPYFMQNKAALYDKNLSLKAKGLHSFLMSKPDDWKIYVRALAAELKEGKDAVGAALSELIARGYIHKKRNHDELGKFQGFTYTVYEIIPYPGNPDTDYPDTENPPLLSKDSTDSINIQSKEEEEEALPEDGHITDLQCFLDIDALHADHPPAFSKEMREAYLARLRDNRKEDVLRTYEVWLSEKVKSRGKFPRREWFLEVPIVKQSENRKQDPGPPPEKCGFCGQPIHRATGNCINQDCPGMKKLREETCREMHKAMQKYDSLSGFVVSKQPVQEVDLFPDSPYLKQKQGAEA